MTVPALPRRRARLLRYGGWQARDYLINVAVISIGLFGLMGTLEIMQLGAMEAMAMGNRAFVANLGRMRAQSFMHVFAIYATVGPIVALSGIIANDRAMGYVRFLFAKPLNPLLFYLQSFLVRLAGYFAVAGVLLAAYGYFDPVGDLERVAVGLLLGFVAYGGVLFLASALTKYDGLVTVAFLLLATLAWGKWETATGVRRFIPYLFPPVGKFSDVNNWVANLNPFDPRAPAVFPGKWVAWTVCYGVACLLLGLVALRKRALVKA
ncbi:MAG: hypothetical protein JWM41_3193 [Gemmatimonadetes bacterium]|nr:hypothetical protein [Gemmatimonadota bacterium]